MTVFRHVSTIKIINNVLGGRRWQRSRWTRSTCLSMDIRNTPSDTEVLAEHQPRVGRNT